jgi:hypothetical protein
LKFKLHTRRLENLKSRKRLVFSNTTISFAGSHYFNHHHHHHHLQRFGLLACSALKGSHQPVLRRLRVVLGGLMVIVLAIGSKVRRLKPGRG